MTKIQFPVNLQLASKTGKTSCLFKSIQENGDDVSGEFHISELAKDLSKFKNSIKTAVSSRERLPQPLFWSLFNSKIKELKERKESTRRIDQLLGKLD